MDGDNQKVQFQEYHVSRSSLEEKSKMIEWVMRLGIAKNKKQASYILLGMAGLIFIVVFILFLKIFGESSMKLQPKEKIFLEKSGNTESYDKKLFQQ